MTRIVLIRPGATDFDRQRRIQGTLDIPLCEEGHREVADLIESLKDQHIEMVYTSPGESARETGQKVAAALGLKCKAIDKLKNIDQGLWQGMLIDDVKKKQPKVFRQYQDRPASVRPPSGEMLSEAHQRVVKALGKLAKKHRHGVIALVAPDPLASLIRGHVLHEEVSDLWKRSECRCWESLTLAEDVPVSTGG